MTEICEKAEKVLPKFVHKEVNKKCEEVVGDLKSVSKVLQTGKLHDLKLSKSTQTLIANQLAKLGKKYSASSDSSVPGFHELRTSRKSIKFISKGKKLPSISFGVLGGKAELNVWLSSPMERTKLEGAQITWTVRF